MANYLRLRAEYYYLRIRIPSDLRNMFPGAEILKSLHTQDKKSARLISLKLLYKTNEVFTLVRSGFIDDDQAKGKLSDVLGRKSKASAGHSPKINCSTTAPTLQRIIDQYVQDHKSAWTAKTTLEYQSYFKLLLNIVGDRAISEIDRDIVRDLRDSLTKLPPNDLRVYVSRSRRINSC